jgi:hypothetical protein
MINPVFVVTKIFIQAPIATGFFFKKGKCFFMIIRVKAVYFNLFDGFTAVGDKIGGSHPCQLCIFFRCCEMWESGES